MVLVAPAIPEAMICWTARGDWQRPQVLGKRTAEHRSLPTTGPSIRANGPRESREHLRARCLYPVCCIPQSCRSRRNA